METRVERPDDGGLALLATASAAGHICHCYFLVIIVPIHKLHGSAKPCNRRLQDVPRLSAHPSDLVDSS